MSAGYANMLAMTSVGLKHYLGLPFSVMSSVRVYTLKFNNYIIVTDRSNAPLHRQFGWWLVRCLLFDRYQFGLQ